MKMGVLDNVLSDVPFAEALAFYRALGIEMLEIGCDGGPDAGHCDVDVLLRDGAAFTEFKGTVESFGLGFSALSVHGNPVHPTEAIAERYDRILRNAVLLAEKLGVDTICTYSGVPGDCDGAIYPNWPTMVWPFDGVAILDYQWKRRLTPYWRAFGEFAAQHEVTKIAIEMRPGFSVFNPDTLLRLREGCGEFIGACFDPSHLIWQGIDCPTAIRKLKGCIYHFHAKDTLINRDVMGRNGFYDPFGDPGDRPFRDKIPPYGTGEQNWREMMTALRDAEYDGALSIEHGDADFGRREGIRKAADFLQSIRYIDHIDDSDRQALLMEYYRGFLPTRGGRN